MTTDKFWQASNIVNKMRLIEKFDSLIGRHEVVSNTEIVILNAPVTVTPNTLNKIRDIILTDYSYELERLEKELEQL